jgi:hypothetical protein
MLLPLLVFFLNLAVLWVETNIANVHWFFYRTLAAISILPIDNRDPFHLVSAWEGLLAKERKPGVVPEGLMKQCNLGNMKPPSI